MHLKERFSREYQLQNEMNELTSGESGHSMNNTEEVINQEASEDLRQAYEQFTNAATSDRAAFQ